MNTYIVDDKQYDVSKLDEEAQSLFSALVNANNEANGLRQRLFVLNEATNSISSKLNEKLTDDALVQDEEEDTKEDS